MADAPGREHRDLHQSPNPESQACWACVAKVARHGTGLRERMRLQCRRRGVEDCVDQGTPTSASRPLPLSDNSDETLATTSIAS